MLPSFQVVATRTVAEPGQRKHVAYSVLVTSAWDSTSDVIERRYNDFLELYHGLRREHGEKLDSFIFPRKVLLGNFSESLISVRAARFECLLRFLVHSDCLRDSKSLRRFLVGPEERQAVLLMNQKYYYTARPVLISVFSILSKVYTNRHPAVLFALCRIVACCETDPTMLIDAEKYGELALKRFETVCDVDLLRFYSPLLLLCSKVRCARGEDNEKLDARLNEMRRQGHRVDNCPKLLEAVMAVGSF